MCYLRHLKKWSRLVRDVKNDEEQAFSFGSWWTVAIIALLIGCVGLTVTFWLFLEPTIIPQKYGVVMDAGSSHSEIFVFTWNGEKPLGTADVKLLHRCFVAGGVNSFASHADDLGRYLGKCIAVTEKQVPSHLRKETPFYVGATAGMRILRDFDPEGAVAVLATLRNFLQTNSTLQIQPDNIGIIPGHVEGTSGWIAVNYLIGTLKKAEVSTKAALDVGGASFQITSALTESGNWTTKNLTLFNRTHKIQSQSFLCYGIGQAQHRHNFLMLKEINDNKGNSSDIKIPINPCLPKGASYEVSELDINGPCTLAGEKMPDLSAMTRISQNKLKKIFKNYRAQLEANGDDMSEGDALKMASEILKSDKENEISSQIIIGSSNAKECNHAIGQLFDIQFCKKTFKYGDCMNGQLVPKVTGELIAFSGLFYHLMILLQVQPYSSLSEYKITVDHICNLDAEHLYAAYPGVDKDVLDDLCFDAMYVYKLLTVGLGIDNSSWNNIDFSHQVNDMDIEWPLGYMLNRTTSFPPTKADVSLSVTMCGILVFIFASMLSTGILFLRHAMKIKRHSASYQRVIADHIDQEVHKFI